MEYPWAPPPLHPQPPQPPPPPGSLITPLTLNSHFPHPTMLNSHFPNPNIPHSHFPNPPNLHNHPQNHVPHNPNLHNQFQNQNPQFNPNLHIQNPSFEPHAQIGNPNLHVQNANLQPQFESPNIQSQLLPNQNSNIPNFEHGMQIKNPNLHNQSPNLHIQNPNLQAQFGNPNLHSQNANLQSQFENTNFQSQLLPNQNANFPNFEPGMQIGNPNLHIQNPNLQAQFEKPNFQNQNPNFGSHGQNPNLQAQFGNPNFQSHQNPNLEVRNPNLHPQLPNPNFQSEFAFDRKPDFENPNLKHQFENPNFHNPNLKHQFENPNFHNPNLKHQFENPSFQSQIHQNPNFHHPPAIQNPQIAFDRKPNFQSEIQNNFQNPHIALDQNPNFDRNFKKPRPDESVSRLIRDHGCNDSILANDEIRAHFNENRMLHDREIGRHFSENRMLHDREIREHFSENRMLHDREIRGNFSENRFLPEREIRGHFNENRMLHEEEIRRNFSENRSLMLHDEEMRRNLNENPLLRDREIRGSFSGNSGLKRPRFDELGMRAKYEIDEFRDERLSGIRPENDLYRRGYEKDSLLRDNLRDRYDRNHGRDEFHSKNYDSRSNVRPNHDRERFENHVLPEISPRKKTFFENEKNLLIDRKTPRFDDRDVAPKAASLFPIAVDKTAPLASSYASFSEKSHIHASSGFDTKEFQPLSQKLSTNHSREGQRFPLINKPKDVNAAHIFKQPHRATRPDHIVVILRGLPGSGKSYLAKMMRDLEVENGGSAPRIHSMDDYFMTEVEKVEESDNVKSSGSSRGKKPVVKMVMEYCYEAEMEEAYRSSMLKTFKKTLDEGAFQFVIVDDRNLRVADFAQFWATAKRSGYEVYLLEATYKDPAGCAARNIHGFTLDDIQKMADQWEEAPPMYLKLDAKSLSQTDDLKENEIQEVDMDTDDGESEDAHNGSAEGKSVISAPATEEIPPSGASKAEGSWNAESEHIKEEVKELGRSKWSSDLEDDDADRNIDSKKNHNALSAIVKAYKREGKSVHWGDQVVNTGFSIAAAKRANTSLVIGPGSGYNSKSNPLPEDLVSPGNSGKIKTQGVFKERIRAEHESFRAVFDKRRHRIGGLDSDEE